MNYRARDSLTYRILTDVLGLALVLGAFSLSLVTDYTVSMLIRNVVLYTIVFAALVIIWRRLGNMFDLGILGGRVSGLVGMVMALNIVLAPVFLKILISDKLISDNDDAMSSFVAVLLAVSFGLVMLLLMFLVRRSHAYSSKAHWRLIHHSLLAAGGIFLLSLLMPLSFAPFADIPGRALLWALALVVMPVIQRLGSNLVANPAQPQKTHAASTSAASPSTVSIHSSSSHYGEPHSADGEREGHEPHTRPPRRRGRGQFRRHSGPSRRRM